MAPSAPRTRAAAALRMKQIALDNQSRTIRRLRAQLATERRGLATMKKELEDTQVALEASHKALVEEKDSLLQTIQGLQEANDAPAPFDDECEEEPKEHPEEEEIEDIPMGEGEIDDE
ncbi:plastoglobulin-1, chloroplastic [Dorcoceras hygrometricum]|uniref:Plastoglobulin-1, chloroplastic n=1 Tax=Dorcoceras hygrometricum TaxID=472368 RepID=A0A2Z7AK26_9LAMI|nr:plastoglobulin-1, chloroplastic [Dorcoceras hygrometricum]